MKIIRSVMFVIILILVISFATALETLTDYTDGTNDQTITTDFYNSLTLEGNITVLSTNLDFIANTQVNYINFSDVSRTPTLLPPENIEHIKGTSNFFLVDNYHRIYQVDEKYNSLNNVTLDNTCGDGFLMPETEPDIVGVSVIGNDTLYLLHRDLVDTDSYVFKLNFSQGNTNGCKDYWIFSNYTTIADATDIYVDENEEYMYVTQYETGTDYIYTMYIGNCTNDCYTNKNWSITATEADSYESIDSDDNGITFWVTEDVTFYMHLLNDAFNIQRSYLLNNNSPIDGVALTDTYGHASNESVHWLIDTNSNDEIVKFNIDFPRDTLIYVNNNLVFNDTGLLYLQNSTELSPNKEIDLCSTLYSSCNISVLASFGESNLSIENMSVEYTGRITLNFSESTDWNVYFKDDAIYSGSGDSIELNVSQLSQPKVSIFFNSDTQLYEFWTGSDSETYLQQDLQVEDGLDTTLTFQVDDYTNIIDYGRVEVSELYRDDVVYAKLTDGQGEAKVNVNSSKPYQVCIYKYGYDVVSESCSIIGGTDIDDTIVHVLHVNEPEPSISFEPKQDITFNDSGKRLNITLLRDQFDTPEKYNVGLVVIILLSIVISIIFENRVTGSGIVAFGMMSLLFGRIFVVLQWVGVVVMLLIGYKMIKPVTDT